MKHIHSNGITHKDLRPENIMINDQEVIKICEFHSADVLANDENCPNVGFRHYKAPELLLNCRDYKQSIDIFSLGCIFAELFLLHPLFPGRQKAPNSLNKLKF